MGTFCTLLTFVIIASYSWLKVNVLVNRNNMVVVSATKDLFFD